MEKSEIKAKIEQNKKDRRLSNEAADAELARLERELAYEQEVTYSTGDRFECKFRSNKPAKEHVLARIGYNVGMIDVVTGENWGGHYRAVSDVQRITEREMADLMNSSCHTRIYDARKGQNV